MFNIGDFVIQGLSGYLLVAVTPTMGRLLCKAPGRLFLVHNTEMTFFSTKDRVATAAELTKFEKKQGWPKWVADAKNNPLNKGAVALPLTETGYVDHKPRPAPKPDPYAGRPTLQTFQQTCAHKFQIYTGFSRVFEYCIFCDVKRNV